ncbi:uncharacterized protein [Physcomitrium patens]|uniref:H15 domain-containing protein n=1 Tax=Physcomitrium patens TaxID=3218 RepID=A0A2K1KUB8_PHYPA|nr:histone H1-I-like [Physcomitrium patens]XP_024370137.1 histone H1-I-like [Physcomitrium patens]PNR57384.1 hypothetical protein PHYPA_004378 [Physcomitrium patens]|eukprot:XP_024370136.1 histone H1-I-like [Physcomitrella patens]
MGNKQPCDNRIHTPYSEMVGDAISALKDRPGSTQSDIFNYLETKYRGKISPIVKKSLKTVIRSIIKTKKGQRRRGRVQLAKNTDRRVRFKAKAGPRKRRRKCTQKTDRAPKLKAKKLARPKNTKTASKDSNSKKLSKKTPRRGSNSKHPKVPSPSVELREPSCFA